MLAAIIITVGADAHIRPWDDVGIVPYPFTYDGNGNITSISGGNRTVSYVYDSANQLIRENNQKLGKTWTWTYDNAGNILSKSEYAYTTGELGTPIDTVTYTYGDADWGDLLTGYDGKVVTSDAIGNMLSDGVHNYTWEHGRQLASMDSWDFEYDTDGLRTRRYDSETGTAYTYRYSDGLLRKMDISSPEIYGSFTFRYDNTGKPISFYYNLTDEENAVTYSGEAFYVVNVQGDVIELISDEMDSIGSYTYDAWGVVKSVQVYDDAFELVVNLNPLRYRGYVYDHETGLYYLQSRYYNPEMGRFINADSIAYLGADVTPLSYNLFSYCKNNPVALSDPTGHFGLIAGIIAAGAIVGGLMGAFTAATTGGNILESAIEGCITGALSATCGMLITNPFVAVGVATLGGAVVDFATQATTQYVENKKVDLSEIDYGRTAKTGLQTGLGAAIPSFGNAAGNAVDAFGTALIWAEGSAIIACTDIIITNVLTAEPTPGFRTAT